MNTARVKREPKRPQRPALLAALGRNRGELDAETLRRLLARLAPART